MFRLIERCLRDGDDQAWIELWEVFEDASATEVRRILVENGVTPKDADAVVTKCWGELTKSKKTLRPLLGKSLRELKEWFVDGVVLGTFKPLEAGKVLLGELTNKKGKRVKSRSMQFETLEARQMLAADLLNFQLYEDIGAADNVSTNPTVTAVVGDLQPNAAKAAVQFDHNGDGSPEETVADLVAGNTLFYDPGDPGVTDPAFPTEGPVTLLYRVLEQDAAGVNLDTGDWQAFDFFVGDETAATPQFGNDGSYVFEVGEDVAVTTVIGSVQATDLQADLVTYSIASWSQDQPFSIDPDSGEVTVAGLLNYEANSTHYIDVLATDPYGNQSSAYLSIYVQDVEENPQFTSGGSYGSYAFEVEEEVPFGTVVGTVVATDPQGDSVIYSIAPWNEDEPFAIDPSTGEITAAARLDYEFEGSYYVDIQATDPQGNQSTAYVSIYLQNVVEEPEYGSDASGGDGYESTGYVDESSFATIDILDFLPALPSQAYAGELIYFLPDGDQNTTTTTTDFSADSYYDEDGGLHEFEQTINYTLSVTSTVLDDGTWTHQETLTSTYDYVTLDDTTDIDRWLHQWGFYNWTFIASGALDSITYSTATQGSDSYQKTYSDSWLEVNEDFSVDRETYAYESDGSDSFYDFYEASTTFSTDNSYSTSYTELGDGSGQSNYAGVGTYDYLTGSGDLSAGDGSESHEWGDWQESWSDSYGYVYIGAGTITGDTSQTQTKVGTLNETGSGEGTYAYSWQGDYVRSAEYPDEEFAGGTSITQTDQWSGTETEDYDYSYDDLTTYQSDGGKTLHVLESGSESSTYIYAGTGTYQRESEEGDLWLGEGAEETYADSYTDAYSDASTFDYTDNLLWTTDPEGNATRTGTSKQVGGVSGSSTYTFASAYTYDDAYFEFNDAGYSSISQSDNTAKVWMDTWGYGYNDLTTYNLDDTYTVHVLESGDGSGSYDFADDGTYAWLAQAGDLVAGDGWKETYNDSYDGSSWDTYQYEYNKDVTKTYAPSSEDESTEGEEAVNVTRTGTYHETGNTEGGSSSTWSGTSTYDDAVPDGFKYSEVALADSWQGSSSSSYDSIYDDLTTYSENGGKTYDLWESGGGGSTFEYAGVGAFDWYWQDGTLLLGDGAEETYADSYTDVYSQASTYDYTDTLLWTTDSDGNTTKTGTSDQVGGVSGSSTYTFQSAYNYDDVYPWLNVDSLSSVSQSDNTARVHGNNWGYGYHDVTTYYADDTYIVHVLESGDGSGSDEFAKDGTYAWIALAGDLAAGDGWKDTYNDSYDKSAWDTYQYQYEKDVTRTYTPVAADESSESEDAASEEVVDETSDTSTVDEEGGSDAGTERPQYTVAKTGTYHETGSTQGGSLSTWSGNSTYQDAVPNELEYSEANSADNWQGSSTSSYDSIYDDLTTYNSDGSRQVNVIEFGGGSSTYTFAGDGTDSWRREFGDLAAGEGAVETYQDSYEETAWSNHNYDYDKNITTAYAAPSSDDATEQVDENGDPDSSDPDSAYDDSPHPSEIGLALREFELDDGLLNLLAYQLVANSNATKTGTYHATGGGESGSTYQTSGTSSYEGALWDGGEYHETLRSGQWTESFTDNSDYTYDNLTTYSDDGSVSKQVQELGGGDAAWDYAASGTHWVLAKTGDVAAGDGWQETYSDSYEKTYWDDFVYGYETATNATVTEDLQISKTGTREQTGGSNRGGLGSESIDTMYASASTYSDGQSSSSTADHWEKTWDYVDDNLYAELITFQDDGGISYAINESGGGSSGWDWQSTGDELNHSTSSDGSTAYTSNSDGHHTASGFENYDYEYDDTFAVTVAADGSESISGGWHAWGGGDGNADLHRWGTSSWTEQYTGSDYTSSSSNENAYDTASNDSYLHTFDNSGSYPEGDSYGGEVSGGDTYVSGNYQESYTSSGNWTETHNGDEYGGGGWTDGDSYSDSFVSDSLYDELLTNASPDFWYFGYGSEQYAFAGDLSGIAAQAWDDAIDFLTSATIEETDDEQAPPNESLQETSETSSPTDQEEVDSNEESDDIPEDLLRRLRIDEARVRVNELLRENRETRELIRNIEEEIHQQSIDLEDEKENLEDIKTSLSKIRVSLGELGTGLHNLGASLSELAMRIPVAKVLINQSFGRFEQSLQEWGEELDRQAKALWQWGKDIDEFVEYLEERERILGPFVHFFFEQKEIDAAMKNSDSIAEGAIGLTLVRWGPYASEGTDYVEATTGVNQVTGDKISGWQKAATWAGFALPFVPSSMVRRLFKRGGDEVVEEVLEESTKRIDDIGKAPKGPTEKIFKAPQPGKGQKQLTEGFDPADFAEGDQRAYFARQRELAEEYSQHYGDGVLEVEIPKDVYDARIRRHEVPYQDGPQIELPIPHEDFDVLNEAQRRLLRGG